MPELSPSAQAVHDAFMSAPLCAEVKLAAALRTAANQLDHPTSAHTLYVFADELETFAQ
jgi:hypothetical protein